MKNITKKILALSILASSISLAGQAFAKTEGSYIGLDLMRAQSKHHYANSGALSSNYPQFDASATGYGVNYKYALNFNDFFLAPNAFYEHIGTKANDKDHDSVSINNRYGAKLDFGYDASDNLALYLTAGLANTSYNVDWKSIHEKKSGSKSGVLAGLGVSYYPHKNIALNLEYNIQKLTLATPTDGSINQAKTTINVAKVEVSYHF